MTQEIEIEFKNLLTEDEFNHLLHIYPFPECGQTQINYYFETDLFELQKQRCALRIREKNKAYQLTLKEPHVDGILETHDQLSKNEALNWLSGNIIYKPNIAKQLKQLNIAWDSLTCYGSLTTTRYEIHVQDALLVLDHSTYHDHTDFELEIEVMDKQYGLNFFDELLSQHQIPKRKTPNKIERFFNTLQK